MRWKKRIKKRKEKPKQKRWEIGDKKVETKFAWNITQINETDFVWLEKYHIHYEFKEFKYRVEKPLFDICYEDGSSCARLQHQRFVAGLRIPVKYETHTRLDWVECKKTYSS